MLPVVALALGYAILTWPLVRAAQRFVPRGAAVALVDAGLALAAAALAYAAAPLLYAQAQSSIAALQQIGSGVLGRIDVDVAAYAGQGLQAALALVRSAFSLAALAFVVPVLAGYFQLDAARYERALYAILPEAYHRTAREAIDEISRSVGRFVRGQVIVSGIVALLVYAVLRLTGVPYAAAIAAVTGLLDLVPYLGGLAAFVPSLLFASADGGIVHALAVGALLAAVFEFEAQVLSPQIMGANTGLPPSVVMLALLAGSAAFGVFGLYVAVPVAAAGAAVVRVVLAAKGGSSSSLLPASRVGSKHAHHGR